MGLPLSFDQSIVATQVQRQNISTMEFAQTATQIRAQTAVIAAEFDRKVKVIKAQGKANFTIVTRSAKAKARSQTLDTEAQVLQDIKSALKLSSEDLVQYQQFAAVQMLRNASVYYGFDDDTQVLLKQSVPRSLTAMNNQFQPAIVGDSDG